MLCEEEKPKTAGELKITDLPPIAELTISVPEDSLIQVGKVLSIVDVLVVVESLKSMPPLDLDTILFDLNGKPLGQIFDVFGPITEPLYSIRFTNAEQIREKNITCGMEAYFVPQTDRKITKFAFINEIKKIKGTDASWENDNEPPESVLEFSDDEDEKLAKREMKERRLEQKLNNCLQDT